ncbi:hypothetical protein D3C71_968860 [compost metagenome]
MEQAGLIALPGSGRSERAVQFLRGLGLFQQRRLERGVGDAGHGNDALFIGAVAQIGDAVFVDEEIAQMARNGGVAVVPAHVGLRLACIITQCAEHQDAARVRQRMCHRHEVVLPTHTGYHSPIFQCIGSRRTQRSGDHAGVEEACIAALQTLQGFVATIELIDLADPAHADRAAFVLGQMSQPVVELWRTEIEGAVQVLAFGSERGVVRAIGAAVFQTLHHCKVIQYLAADHATLHQYAEAFVEHFAATVQADFKRPQPAGFLHHRVVGKLRVECPQNPPIARVVGMPQHQCVAEGVGQRADADLQCAAVANQGAGMEADGVVGIADWLTWQAEQMRVRTRRHHDQVEEVRLYRGGAAEPRQHRVDFGDQQRTRQAACSDGVQRVLGDVVVAGQR